MQKKRLLDIARRAAARDCCLYSDFLSLGEQSALKEIRTQLATPFLLYGGAENAERRMARFGFESDDNTGDFPIECIKLSPKSEKFASPLSHRDYLGALMNLGIEREKLGDIVIKGTSAFLLCHSTLAPYIAENLQRAGRVALRCTLGAQPPQGELFTTEDERLRITSLRLDALVAAAYNISRAQASELFAKERVFADGMAVPSPAYAPKEGEIISVRGSGRFIYCGTEGLSKKGKLIVSVKRFV